MSFSSHPSSFICPPSPFSAATACSNPSWAVFKSACASCPLPRILSLGSTACAPKRLYSVLRSRISTRSSVRRGNSSSASSRVNWLGGIPPNCRRETYALARRLLCAPRRDLLRDTSEVTAREPVAHVRFSLRNGAQDILCVARVVQRDCPEQGFEPHLRWRKVGHFEVTTEGDQRIDRRQVRDVTVDRPRRPRYLFRQLLLRQRPAKALEPRSMLGLLVENRLYTWQSHNRKSTTRAERQHLCASTRALMTSPEAGGAGSLPWPPGPEKAHEPRTRHLGAG